MADALDSGSSGSNAVWVQVPSPAPEKTTRLIPSRFFNDVCKQVMLLRNDVASLMMCA